MPHLRLEYSSNVSERINLKELFPPCHKILVDLLGAEMHTCQSRAIPQDHFFIGEGSSTQAYVYLEVIILQGRSFDQLQEMGRQLLKFLEGYFSRSLQHLSMQISVRFIEFQKSHYFKKESMKP